MPETSKVKYEYLNDHSRPVNMIISIVLEVDFKVEQDTDSNGPLNIGICTVKYLVYESAKSVTT